MEPIQILRDAKDSINKIAVSNDKIITASVDGSVRTYDIRKGGLISDKFDFIINGMDLSPDEKFMLISGLDGKIKLVENETGAIVNIYKDKHISKNYSMTVKYSLDLDYVMSTSENGDIVMYDVLGRDEMDKVLKGHTKSSSGFDIHPMKKNLLVSAGYDGKLFLWDLKN
jgi:mitogen-activated protein kinase organizer 1